MEPDVELDDDEWAELSLFAAKQAGTEAISAYRREILSVVVGGAVGGATLTQLVQNAEAAASTSDSDGNVGTPSDRVDVFGDGVDMNSTVINGNELYIQGSSPSSASTGDIWIDNDG